MSSSSAWERPAHTDHPPAHFGESTQREALAFNVGWIDSSLPWYPRETRHEGDEWEREQAPVWGCVFLHNTFPVTDQAAVDCK